MTASDRLGDGYEPRHDIDFKRDLERGRQAELWVTSIIDALDNDRGEVKKDDRYKDTGNLYVEFECLRRGKWRPSGIQTTEAEVWTFVVGDVPRQVAFTFPTEFLRELAQHLATRGRLRDQPHGSHPTRGVVVKHSDLMAWWRARERRAS